MPKNEQSAVQILLNEINDLKHRVEVLENTALTYSPRTYREAVYEYRPPDITYAVTDDNVTVPIFIPTNSNVEPRTVTSCRGEYH